jgi:hypothetical protein
MKHEAVRCRDARASSCCCQTSGLSLAHFRAVAVNHHSTVCRIDCLACQDEFFVNNFLDVKENDEHALDSLFRSALKRSFHSKTCVRLILYSRTFVYSLKWYLSQSFRYVHKT